MARREHHYNRGNVSSEVYEVLYYSLLNTGSAERVLGSLAVLLHNCIRLPDITASTAGS